ncbi:MAG: ribosome silencing factor [Muribaculaceae bacterium]|nr:ribosome silencing factor [Muribaculaceae bacterium]
MSENIDLQKLIIEGIENRKGKDITLVDMSHIESAPTPMFIIADGTSTMQVSSIADNVREYVQEQSGIKPYNYDGYKNSEWIVIDYGSILVHIFLPQTRERYNLEELWSDAQINHLPDID